MRRLTENKITGGILLGLVVLAMAAFGTGDIFSGGLGTNLIKAGERAATEQQIDRKFNNYLNNLRREQPGNAISREQAIEQNILDQVFNVERSRLTSLGYARSLGADASGKALAEDVRTIDAFLNPLSGEFDDQYYRNALAGIQVTPKEFEDDTQDRLTLDYLREAIEAGTVAPTDISRIQAIFDGEVRYISWLPVDQSTLPEIAEPTEEELLEFYESRAQAFVSPERRQFSMLHLSADDFLHQSIATETQIQEYYGSTLNRWLATAEQRTFLEAIFLDEDSAKEAFAILAVGGDIAEREGVSVTTRTTTIDAVAIEGFRNALFAPGASAGSVAGPYEQNGAWIIGQLIEVLPGTPKPLEEVRDEVSAAIAAEQAEIAYYTSLTDLDDLIAQGLSLEEIGQSFGAPVISFAPVDTRGVTKHAAFLQALTVVPEAFAQAFNLELGDITDRFDGNTSTVLISIDRIVPQSTPPLSENRDRALASYQNVREGDAMRTTLDSIKAGVDTGISTMDLEAEKYNSAVQRTENGLRRTAPDRSVPRAVLQAAFTIEEGSTSVVQGRTGSELILVKLDTIERPLNSELDVLAPISAPKIAEQLNNDILFAFDQDVQKSVNTRTNDAAFNAYKARLLAAQ